MGLFNRIRKTEKRADEVLQADGAELLRALMGGENMTAEKALEIPAFSSAVDFISSTVAMLPVKLYSENANGKSTDEITNDKRLFLLNDEANGTMPAMLAKRAVVRDMLIYGAGFLYIEKDGIGVRSLRFVKHGDITVNTNSDPIFKDFNIYVGGRSYMPWNFVILTRNSADGVTGVGAVDEHKTLLTATYSAMKYEEIIAKTGGNKKGFIESEVQLTDPAMEKLKRSWNDIYANNENNVLVLNKGLKYVPAASTSVEMQLCENKRANTEQIAQIFGLSPDVLAGSRSTAEYMSAVQTAVLPVVEQFQSALNKSLLLESEKGKKYFTLDTTELLKGDTLSRYQAYEIGLRNNFLKLDEVRYAEDKEPLGFEYMRLGLNDVLYDNKAKTVYTPNMNALANLGGSHLTSAD